MIGDIRPLPGVVRIGASPNSRKAFVSAVPFVVPEIIAIRTPAILDVRTRQELTLRLPVQYRRDLGAQMRHHGHRILIARQRDGLDIVDKF